MSTSAVQHPRPRFVVCNGGEDERVDVSWRRLISDGDVSGALMALLEEHAGADVLIGIGGAQEGLLAACAPKRVLTLDDLCRAENVIVAATGVTSVELMDGVRYVSTGAITQSLVMRSASGTVRWIDAKHDFTRLRKLAGTRYEPARTAAV